MSTGTFGDKSREMYTSEASSDKWVGPNSMVDEMGVIREDGEMFLADNSSNKRSMSVGSLDLMAESRRVWRVRRVVWGMSVWGFESARRRSKSETIVHMVSSI